MSTENVAANNPGQSVTQVTGLECEPCRRLINFQNPITSQQMDSVVEAMKMENTNKTLHQNRLPKQATSAMATKARPTDRDRQLIGLLAVVRTFPPSNFAGC